MGVWIETSSELSIIALRRVTPCMGVWIETSSSKPARRGAVRHTLYGCVD